MPPKRKYWTRSQAKRARTESSIDALPPEILQHIFSKLAFDDLLTAREACHLWRDAVDGCPALRDKFRLVLPHDTSPRFRVMNRGYKPPPAVPASTVAFRGERYFRIGNISSWWARIAATVTCLTFENCDFPVEILRHTPNLHLLELIDAGQNGGPCSGELDFELSLRKLSLTHSRLDHLSRLITHLKVLECYTHDCTADSMIEFIQVQSTLEDLTLEAPLSYLKEFTKLNQLGLKRVSLKPYYREAEQGNVLIQFVRDHPSIEELTISNVFDDKVLNEVLRVLPKLKRFTLHLNESGTPRHTELPTIPNVSPNLEWLSIGWKTLVYVALSGPKLRIQCDLRYPKLRVLHLETVTLSGDSLGNVLRYTPNLHSMTLHECDFDSWHQLLQLITQPKALRHLKLTSFKVLRFEEAPFHCQQPLTNLRFLELGNFAGATSARVHEVFHLFPRLTELRFGPRANVDDRLVLEMCRTLTRLERLTVYCGRTTHASTVNVKWFCRNLKHFALSNPDWELEQDDFDYFGQHLQSFYYLGVEVLTFSLLSCLAQALEAQLWTLHESDSASDSDA